MARSSNEQFFLGLGGNANEYILDQRPCKTIRVVIHNQELQYNLEKSNNHVSLFLLVEESDESSIQVSMTVDSDTDRGMLSWTKQDHQLPNSTIVYHDCVLKNVTTVGHFFIFMQQEGRHMYQYPPSGSGCRFWT